MIRYSIEVPEIGRGTAMIQAYEFTADYQNLKTPFFWKTRPMYFQDGNTAKNTKRSTLKPKNLEGYARHTATREAVHEVLRNTTGGLAARSSPTTNEF